MTDFLGHTVKVGDRAVFTGYDRAQLSVGEILKVTPKGVRIKRYATDTTGTFKTSSYFLKVTHG